MLKETMGISTDSRDIFMAKILPLERSKMTIRGRKQTA
jgi:hypothetical protein